MTQEFSFDETIEIQVKIRPQPLDDFMARVGVTVEDDWHWKNVSYVRVTLRTSDAAKAQRLCSEAMAVNNEKWTVEP